jgi:DNA repair protein RadC
MTITKSDQLAEVQVSYSTKIKSKDRKKITGSKESVDVLRSVWSDKIEYLEEVLILLLNRQNQVLGWCKISSGGTSSSVVDPKVIFQIALNSNASAIILSHNHPSGNLRPSEADNQLTKRIKEGGKILEILLLDHVIITEESYYSYADEGQL